MKTAVFPGTFDPITFGHIDIIERSLKLFDRVVVAILENPAKSALFTVDERIKLINQQFKGVNKRVKAVSFEGLLVDFLKSNKASIIVRGLRAISDYDYEAQMALMNKNLWADVETVFLVAREENSYISSSIVKQVAFLGGDVSRFVPQTVVKAFRSKITKK